jgi:hypothetical protein
MALLKLDLCVYMFQKHVAVSVILQYLTEDIWWHGTFIPFLPLR